MTTLAILGASGHGKVLADCAEMCGWEEIIFYDDKWPAMQMIGVWQVQGSSETLIQDAGRFEGVLVAIGDNSIRRAKSLTLLNSGAHFPVLIHPTASVSRHAKLGAGSVVFAGAVINVDCFIGAGAIINTGATVDHDCVLGDFVHISPGANLAGGVVVGDLSWVGIGSAVRQSIRIGAGVKVGAGAAVVADISDESVVAGVPARYLK